MASIMPGAGRRVVLHGATLSRTACGVGQSVRGLRAYASRAMPLAALTSAEISLPTTPDPLRVRQRIATLAATIDLVALSESRAGEGRSAPLASGAPAREQGLMTVVHLPCRDRNRLALQSQVVGAAAL